MIFGNQLKNYLMFIDYRKFKYEIRIFLTFLLFTSCSNSNEDRLVTSYDFMKFLKSKPNSLIDSSSYCFGQDKIMFEMVEETGKYSWQGEEWHRDNVLPYWKTYKRNDNLISYKIYITSKFKSFLASKPINGIDESSYNNGNDSFFLSLFEEDGQYSWFKYEWHRDNVLPLWRKYKKVNNISTFRKALISDFQLFLTSRPFHKIDSSSFDSGKDTTWFETFESANCSVWKNKEWFLYNVFPKWIEFKGEKYLK